MQETQDFEPIIAITDKAQKKLIEIVNTSSLGKDHGVRIGVVGGGCSGLSYHIDFDLLKDHDNIIEIEVAKVFIDPKSAIYLKDTTLDFQDGLNGKGFIFQNPNATNTCGCGESFSV
ncbi:MAG: iron-sulfur cluster assembly accessory protein [Bacteriovoracales bacterium]|nr:iron-sulfur cluster assembly accessory protein [Bacteriovoracales bacterium]